MLRWGQGIHKGYVVIVQLLNHIHLFVTPWTLVSQAPLSMGFSRKEYRSELPLPSPGDLPNLGIEPGSPALQTDSLPSESPGKPITIIKDKVLEGCLNNDGIVSKSTILSLV